MTAEFKDLISRYVNGAQALRSSVSRMSVEQVLARPIAGKMSTLVVVCHI